MKIHGVKRECEMKRILVAVMSLIFLLPITACSFQTRQDQVLHSLGKYESKHLWTHGKFQDYTDFGIYTFSEADLNGNEYFSVVTEKDVETISAVIDNFENWIEAFQKSDPNNDLVLNYSFDRSIVNAEDYFYFYEKENGPEYGCYDLWLFDTQTNTLYYFHNNI